jgi:hypothetical protein
VNPIRQKSRHPRSQSPVGELPFVLELGAALLPKVSLDVAQVFGPEDFGDLVEVDGSAALRFHEDHLSA